ncbi:cell wall metabolism sensor histidine kinase WalK [Tsukamurella sp. 1534]|uniref:sensor histidine kinase n=1 Tax=Tsukamurella sp. 1534 TaxID=1151061 RepID=UPI0002ED26A5|nr:ATP-binding protein [Tsukamurella sp. 1534]
MTEGRAGSRFSARWRILGWLMLSTALVLTAMVISVSSALQARAGHDANDDVAQEVAEFRQFAAEGVNPETARPFTAAEPMLDVFLRRQQPGQGEVLLGIVDGGRAVMSVRGADTPARAEHDVALDTDLLGSDDTSGVAQTPAGELRWAKAAIATDAGESGHLFVGNYTAPAYAEVASTTRLMAAASIGAVALTAILGWLIAGQILRPIRVMRLTAADISREDLTRRIPVQGNDDLADLAVEFNSMLDRLESAFATEQRFVDDAGHELRTPITIIRGHLELLGDDPLERRATLNLVTQELDRMSRIVTDLLALAKAERDDFIQIGGRVDVAELTLDIDAKVQQLAPRTWVLTHVADGPARIDAQRVTQAMLQLAQNATQHTDHGAEIRLSSYFAQDETGAPVVVFAVSDTGPGVPAAEASTIFERFARGTARRTVGEHSGAGLGLAIVRAIADGHNGSAFVDSTPGQGATFGIALPTREERI